MTVTASSSSVTITNGNATAEILNFGATVVSWKVDDKEQLWLSSGSKLDGSRAVRGGIPVCFPRFGAPTGNHPATDKLPQHGFARSVTWEFLGQTDESTAQFGLGPENLTEEFRKEWSYDFTVIYTVKLTSANSLHLSLEIENPSKEAWDFTTLLHTYYRVPNVTDVSVQGFSNLAYHDKVDGGEKHSGSEPLTFKSEVDYIWPNTPRTAVIESKGKPLFTITASDSLPDTVTWNPWTAKAEGMSDFEPKDGFHQMVCIENGSVVKFTNLAPGAKWSGGVEIKAHI